jgi:hypothetical protein
MATKLRYDRGTINDLKRKVHLYLHTTRIPHNSAMTAASATKSRKKRNLVAWIRLASPLSNTPEYDLPSAIQHAQNPCHLISSSQVFLIEYIHLQHENISFLHLGLFLLYALLSMQTYRS